MTIKHNPHILEFTKRRLRLENAIVGGCLLESHVFNEVNKILIEEDFRQPIVKDTWRAMHLLQKKGHPVDMITVIEYFHFKEANPYQASDVIEQLVNRVNDTGNVVRWAFMLVELTFRAKAISKLRIIKKYYPVIVDEMLEELSLLHSDLFAVLEAIKHYSAQVGGLLDNTVDSFYKGMQGRIEEIKYQRSHSK